MKAEFGTLVVSFCGLSSSCAVSPDFAYSRAFFPVWQSEVETCTIDQATEVDFQTVAAGQHSEDGCVTIVAYSAGIVLVKRRSDLSVEAIVSSRRLDYRRIGVSGSPQMFEKLRAVEGQMVRVSGSLYDCSDLLIDDPSFVSGYCHYHSSGPVIDIREIQVTNSEQATSRGLGVGPPIR